MNETRLIELIEKLYSDSLTISEKLEFESLLDQNEENRKLFRTYNFAHGAMAAIELSRKSPSADNITKKQTKRTFSRQWLRISIGAAAACFAIVSLLAIIEKTERKQPQISYCEVTNSDARVTKVLLPDSSVVYLFSGSSIRFPNIFDSNERVVELIGEATFEVKANPKRPFFVNTCDGTRVMAYGTKFNVSGYSNENSTSVYLMSGKVDFIMHEHEKIVLRPEMYLCYDRQDRSVSLNRKSMAEFMALEKGVLLFDNTPLDEIMVKLSRTYHVQIECQDIAAFKYSYTGSFKEESIYQVMDILVKSSPHLRWKKQGDTFVFFQSNK